MITHLDARFNREILHGMVTYARQHTNWRLVQHVVMKPADSKTAQPAGVLLLAASRESRRVVKASGVPYVRSDRD